MNKILSTACLIGAVLSNVSMADSYLGYSVKSLDFMHSEETDAIVYEDSYMQTVDFTLSLGDDYFVGAALDLNQDQERSRKILVKLGFEDWGAALESGTIAGRFSNDSDLYYQPTSGQFEYDYEGFRIYKRDGWNSKSGLAYAKWQQPSKVAVSLDWNDSACATRVCELTWVDPVVDYEFLGWFMTNNLMERLTEGARYEHGLNFETQAEFGFMRVQGSDANISRANREVDQTITNDSAEGIGTRSTFRVGYYTGGRLAGTEGYSLAVGLEGSMTGFVLGGRSSVDEDYVTTPDQYIISYGPFLAFMLNM